MVLRRLADELLQGRRELALEAFFLTCLTEGGEALKLLDSFFEEIQPETFTRSELEVCLAQVANAKMFIPNYQLHVRKLVAYIRTGMSYHETETFHNSIHHMFTELYSLPSELSGHLRSVPRMFRVGVNGPPPYHSYIQPEENKVPEASIHSVLVKGIRSEMVDKGKDLLAQYRAENPMVKEPKPPKVPKVAPKAPEVHVAEGDIVFVSDPEGTHKAVYLGGTEDAFLLLVTSSPYWNPHARELSLDEQQLLRVKKTSYFAPVVRPIHLLSSMGYSLPSHRVESLRAEFEPYKTTTF